MIYKYLLEPPIFFFILSYLNEIFEEEYDKVE